MPTLRLIALACDRPDETGGGRDRVELRVTSGGAESRSAAHTLGEGDRWDVGHEMRIVSQATINLVQLDRNHSLGRVDVAPDVTTAQNSPFARFRWHGAHYTLRYRLEETAGASASGGSASSTSAVDDAPLEAGEAGAAVSTGAGGTGPASAAVQVATTVATRRLRVTVNEDFLYHIPGGGTDRHRPNRHPIRDLTVDIEGTAVPAQVTNNQGSCRLATAGMTGDYVLRVRAADESLEQVGPLIADPLASPPRRLYRPLDVRIRLENGGLAEARIQWPDGVDRNYAGIGNNRLARPTSNHLPLDLKPVWMQSPKDSEASRVRSHDDIDLVVIHCTSGQRIGPTSGQPLIGPAISVFTGNTKSIHYLIDVDGHVVKMMRDSRKVGHINPGQSQWGGAGAEASWAGQLAYPPSIGIEVVHNPSVGDYPAPQKLAVFKLVQRLVAHYGVPHERVIGHCDVSYHPFKHKGSFLDTPTRPSDPGPWFDWPAFEGANLGMKVTASRTLQPGDYGGAFHAHPTISLREDDRDASGSTPNRYGGSARSDVPAPGTDAPIAELQRDLRAIGYRVDTIDGRFTRMTKLAVKAFQAHFFDHTRFPAPSGRRRALSGRVDPFTAELIKKVRAP